MIIQVQRLRFSSQFVYQTYEEHTDQATLGNHIDEHTYKANSKISLEYKNVNNVKHVYIGNYKTIDF